MKDVRVENHGSIFLFRPLTQVARDWMDEHLPGDRMEFGGAVVVEPRYAKDIADGLTRDGLQVE